MTLSTPPDVPFLDLAPTTRAVEGQVVSRWLDVLDSNEFIAGEAVSGFEAHFAALCSTEHAVGVGNGTDALAVTLRALDIGPGDEVIVPCNTFVATVEAVVLVGASPRFVDVDPETLLLTPEILAAAVTRRTRAVIVVHLYGQMADMPSLVAAANGLHIALLEDAAQAHGATYADRPAGSFGIAGCFSFYPGKNLGAFGDAGAVVTSDADLAMRLRSMCDHGRAPGDRRTHELVGTNSRLDTLQAVVLDAKLPLLSGWNAERRRIDAAYRLLLDDSIARPVRELSASRGAHHLAVVRVADREVVRERLAGLGIGTGIHYPTPCHRMAPYAGYSISALSVAEQAADEVLSLPLFPGMTDDQVARVCEAVHVVGGRRLGVA